MLDLPELEVPFRKMICPRRPVGLPMDPSCTGLAPAREVTGGAGGGAQGGRPARRQPGGLAAVVIGAQGELVSIQLCGHSWVHWEYWPMITPCFQVRAIDGAGDEHEGMAGGGLVSSGHEGSRRFWFWPPVDQARKSLRVTVSTLWEAAWAEIGLLR